MFKRLNRELKDLQEKYGHDNVVLSVHDSIVKNLNAYMNIKVEEDNLIFHFSDAYPFRVPKLQINGVTHSMYFNMDKEQLKELKKKHNMLCLCCSTKLCPHNWSPGDRLINVIEQFKQFKKIKTDLNSLISLWELNKLYDYILPEEMINEIAKWF